MSQILLLREGNSVRTKQSDLEELNKYKRLLQEAREAGTVDAETSALLEAIAKSGQNYLTADPLHNRNARWFQHSLNRRMVDILNGGMGYDPLNTEVAKANYFGNYSRPEIESITNDIVRKLRTLNQSSPATSAAAPSQTISDESAHHVYDWLGGQDLSLLPASTTTKEKIGLIIGGLQKGIADVIAARTANKTVHRYDISRLADAQEELGLLLDLKNRLGSEDLSDEAAMSEFTKILANGNFAIDSDKFKKFFYGSRSGESGSSSETASYQSSNEALNNYAKQQGWKLAEKDGAVYAINPLTGTPIQSYGYIFNDFTSPNYKKGIFTDASGKIHFGALEGEGAVDKEALGDIYTNAIEDAKARSKKQVVFHPYDTATMYNQVLDEIIAAGKKHPEAGQALTALLTNPQLAFADLSQHYGGDDYVFAIGNTREFDDADASPYGHDFRGKYIVRYNPNAEEGNRISFSLFDPTNYQASGILSERANQFAGVDKQSIYNLDALKDIVGIDYEGIKTAYQSAPKYTKKSLYDYEGKDAAGSTAASRNLSNMVLWALDNYDTADGKIFFKEFFNENPVNFAVSIYKNWRAGKINLSPEIRDRILAIIVLESNKVASHKEGGVIKAERGTTVMTAPEIKQESKKELKSVSDDRDIAGNSTMWTGIDTARLITTIADIGAAGAAFAPGVGTAASGVLSAGTTITDLVLDAMDPAVSQNQMWKNLGTNTAIAAATLVGGGVTKAAKITKNLIRLAPKVMAIYQFADPEVRNVWLKVSKGEFEKLTRNEVRTLMYSLKAVAGGVQSAGASINVSRRNIAPGTKTGNKVVKTSNNKTYTLTPEEIKNIEQAGRNGGKNAADKAFKDILKAKGINQKEIKEAVLPELEQFGKEGTPWYKLWNRKLTTQDEISGISGYDKALQDYFKADPYRRGYPVAGKEGSTKSVPDWLKWLPSDYQMANEGIHWGVPGFRITARGRYEALLPAAATPAKHDGGKLQRLEQFINKR